MDYYLSNQAGAPFRAELNQVLAAVRCNNAGSNKPSVVTGQTWLETDTNTFWLINAQEALVKIFTTDKPPTKSEIGLGSVPNYSATSSLTDGSSNKFATAEATKNLATNKLDKTAKAADSAKFNGQPASFYAPATHTHSAKDVGAAPAQHSHKEGDLPNASTSAQGVVQLSNKTNGSSQTLAVTELALKNAIAELRKLCFYSGMIVDFAGTEAQIPTGWQLCNGQGECSNGIKVPDLRDRFVIGAGKTYSVGRTGGAVSANTNSSGSHTHSVSVGNTTLSQTQTPNHTHLTVKRQRVSAGSLWDDLTPANSMASVADTGSWSECYTLRAGSDVPDVSKTSAAGNSGSHNHSGSSGSAGSHYHSVATMPPYYALCKIIKL